jgi:hypothetical protein
VSRQSQKGAGLLWPLPAKLSEHLPCESPNLVSPAFTCLHPRRVAQEKRPIFSHDPYPAMGAPSTASASFHHVSRITFVTPLRPLSKNRQQPYMLNRFYQEFNIPNLQPLTHSHQSTNGPTLAPRPHSQRVVGKNGLGKKKRPGEAVGRLPATGVGGKPMRPLKVSPNY